jgi:hypothetical protein
MGFVVFMVIGVYLLISFGVVAGAVSYATKHGKSSIRWGLSAALVMFLIPGWDWIPTVVVHKYYCEKEAGFWVYKTLDQWKVENPGGLEGLVANKGAPSTRNGDDTNFTDIYFLNPRINKVVQEHRVSSVIHVFRHEEDVVDAKNNLVMARYVDFRAGYPSGVAGIAPRSAGLAALKFWLVSGRCSDSGMHNDAKFYEFKHQLVGR